MMLVLHTPAEQIPVPPLQGTQSTDLSATQVPLELHV